MQAQERALLDLRHPQHATEPVCKRVSAKVRHGSIDLDDDLPRVLAGQHVLHRIGY